MKSITQAQYDLLHPYLPVQRGNVRVSNLTLINAVLYIAENGCKWRSLPPEFGNWNTIYVRIRRWAENGVLDRLFEALQAHNIIRVSVDCIGLDSTSIKVTESPVNRCVVYTVNCTDGGNLCDAKGDDLSSCRPLALQIGPAS